MCCVIGDKSRRRRSSLYWHPSHGRCSAVVILVFVGFVKKGKKKENPILRFYDVSNCPAMLNWRAILRGHIINVNWIIELWSFIYSRLTYFSITITNESDTYFFFLLLCCYIDVPSEVRLPRSGIAEPVFRRPDLRRFCPSCHYRFSVICWIESNRCVYQSICLLLFNHFGDLFLKIFSFENDHIFKGGMNKTIALDWWSCCMSFMIGSVTGYFR